MFFYILAEYPVGSRRRIRTTGNRVVIGGMRLSQAHTQLGRRAQADPVVIPMPPFLFGRFSNITNR